MAERRRFPGLIRRPNARSHDVVTGPGGPAPFTFTPLNLDRSASAGGSGDGYWNSTLGVTIGTSGVSVWENQFTTGTLLSDYVQNTASARPQVVTVNGVDSIQFNGVDQYMVTSQNEPVGLSSDFTLWMCYRLESATNFGIAGAVNFNIYQHRQSSTTGKLEMRMTGGTQTVATASSEVGNTVTSMIARDHSTGGAWPAYVNNTSLGNIGSGSTQTNNPNPIGARIDAALPANISLFAVVMANCLFTSEELANLQTWAVNEFGVGT